MSLPTVPVAHGPGLVGLLSLVIEPSGRYVYVSTDWGDGLVQYAISPADGSLSFVRTSTAPVLSDLTAHPSGGSLYGSSAFGPSVYQFTIDPVTGALAPMTQDQVPLAGSPAGGVVIHPNGRYAYVSAGYGANEVTQFAVSPIDGSLTPLSSLARPNTGPVSIDPSGQYLYVSGNQHIWQYRVSSTDGSLTPLTPADVPLLMVGSGVNVITTVGP